MGSYINSGMAFGEMLIRKFTDKANILLNSFSLFLHLLDAVLAPLLLQPLEDILILLNYFN